MRFTYKPIKFFFLFGLGLMICVFSYLLLFRETQIEMSDAILLKTINRFSLIIPVCLYGFYRFFNLAFRFNYIEIKDNEIHVPTMDIVFHMKVIDKSRIVKVRRFTGPIPLVILELGNEKVVMKEKYFKQEELNQFLKLLSH